ncbi:MAG: hypothetical protein P4L90_02635 [Rhodopila sp.]|nr:hypothetical protein [Rhodopila sp.]
MAVLPTDVRFDPNDFGFQLIDIVAQFLDPETVEQKRLQPAPLREGFVFFPGHSDLHSTIFGGKAFQPCAADYHNPAKAA